MARKRTNKLDKLKGEDGLWRENARDMHKLIYDHFTKLYTSGGNDLASFLECMPMKVIATHNDSLLADFTAEDMKSALFAMHLHKAPGLDEMNPAFF